jgi:hypothetical protein
MRAVDLVDTEARDPLRVHIPAGDAFFGIKYIDKA